MSTKKIRYIVWAIAIVLSIIFVLINNLANAVKKEKQKILIYAPYDMCEAFSKTVDDVKKINKNYEIVYTDDINQANFKVTCTKDDNNKLFAYTPIVGVIKNDENMTEFLKNQKILTQSSVLDEVFDLDVKRLIEYVLSDDNTSGLKIAFPSKDSNEFEDLYNLLLINMNEGSNVISDEDILEYKKIIDDLFVSKNIVYYSSDNVKQNKGFAKDIIYFMTEQKIVDFYCRQNVNVNFDIDILYPKYVVYNNFYIEFDDIGRKFFEGLDIKTISYNDSVGYIHLYGYGFCCEKFPCTYKIKNEAVHGQRNVFNVVEVN